MESPNATIVYASAGAIMSRASRKYQDAVLNGKTCSSSAGAFRPCARCGQIGGGERLGMRGHRAAFASDVKADRQLATEELRCCRIVHEGEAHRIAPHRQARGHSGRERAGEADRLVAGGDECG